MPSPTHINSILRSIYEQFVDSITIELKCQRIFISAPTIGACSFIYEKSLNRYVLKFFMLESSTSEELIKSILDLGSSYPTFDKYIELLTSKISLDNIKRITLYIDNSGPEVFYYKNKDGTWKKNDDSELYFPGPGAYDC